MLTFLMLPFLMGMRENEDNLSLKMFSDHWDADPALTLVLLEPYIWYRYGV